MMQRPSRWEEIQASFDSLVELDVSERAGRLALLASNDPELCQEVERLHTSTESAGRDGCDGVHNAVTKARWCPGVR